jgi:hypothetical protein
MHVCANEKNKCVLQIKHSPLKDARLAAQTVTAKSRYLEAGSASYLA